jgi:hypothetical protein
MNVCFLPNTRKTKYIRSIISFLQQNTFVYDVILMHFHHKSLIIPAINKVSFDSFLLFQIHGHEENILTSNEKWKRQ